MNDLPESWATCDLGNLIDFGKAEKAEPSQIGPEDWVLELEDIEKDTSKVLKRVSFGERKSKSTKNRFQHGDVLYGKLRPYLNKVVLADGPGFCTTEILPLRPPREVYAGYLFHWLKHPRFLEYVNAVSHGLNMPRLGTEAGQAAPFVLAPRAEQERIADKLDALLARVDTCSERLNNTAGVLERFRTSVLWSATKGTLTADWRETDAARGGCFERLLPKAALPPDFRRLKKKAFRTVPIPYVPFELPSTWSKRTVRELYEANYLLDFADGNHGSLYPRREDFGSEGVHFVTASQMGSLWQLDLDSCPRLAPKKANALTKGWARNGDVLLSHNATIGRVALVEDIDEPVLLGTSVTFYRFNPHCFNPRFARIVFSSPFVQEQLQSVMAQTTRDQVPITAQVSLMLVLPPLAEQAEIVRRVESLFALADAIEAKCKTARAQVERLTPAILAKAFRGELVPQDPSDELASALLARIEAERAAAPARKTRARKSAGGAA